jgi:hypothetical protein
MNEPIVCPGCGQGWVRHFRILALEKEIYLCDECETMWATRQGIGRETPANFVDFMRSYGLKGLWDEIEEI